MRFIRPASLPSTWSIVTIILLAAIFCYYYFVVVNNKEDYLTGRNFRVLGRINDNLGKTNENVIKNARNIFDYSRSKTGRSVSTDSLASLYRAYGTAIIFPSYHPLSLENSSVAGRINQSSVVFYDNEFYLDYGLPTLAGDSTFYELSFRFPFQSLINQSMVKDVFQEFLVIHGDQVVYSSCPVILNKNRLDSLFNQNISRLFIEGREYKSFSQPSAMKIDGKELLLVGLADLTKFNNEKYSISTYAVIIIFFIFFLLVLGYPFFKIRLIGPLERIIQADVVQALISFVLGSSVLTIIVIGIIGHYEENHGHVSRELQALSVQIQDSVDSELKHEVLPQLERLNNQLIAAGISQNLEPVEFEPDNFVYKNLELVFWMDKSGFQRKKWSATSLETPFIDVSQRDYFKRIANGGYWKKDNYPFYLQSIKSWNTGKNYAVISTLSGIPELPVSAVTTELHALSNPILPHGFGFAIIDESGEVWFHTDEHKNLQENFIDECDQSEDLRALLFSKRSGQINARYHGANSYMQIDPLKDTSLTLITFVNKDYYRAPFDQIISLTFIMNLFLFLFIALLFFFSRIVDFYPKKLAGNTFDFTLFRPMANKSFRYIFGMAINVFNLSMLIYLTRVFYRNPLIVIFLLIISCLYQVMFLYFIMKKDSFARLWLYRKVFRKNKNLVYDDQVDGFLIVVIGFILAANIFAFFFLIKDLNTGIKLLAYQGMQGLFFITMFFENKMPRIPYRYLKLVFKNYQLTHNLFFVSSIIFISVFPSYRFYQIAHDYELDHFIKHAQIQLAKDIDQRNLWMDNKFSARDGISEPDLKKLKNRGFFVQSFYQTELINERPQHSQIVSTTGFDKVFSYLRIPYHKIIKDTKFLKLHNDSLKSLATFYLANNSPVGAANAGAQNFEQAEKVILEYVSHNHVTDTLTLASMPDRIQFSDMRIFDSYMVMIVFVFSGIILFSVLFKFGLRRFLGMDIRQNRLSSKFDAELIGNWFENKNLFIVVPPYTRKEALKRKLAQWVSGDMEKSEAKTRPYFLKSIDLNSRPSAEQYNAWMEEIDISQNTKNVCTLYHLESVICQQTDRDLLMNFIEKLIYHKNVAAVVITSSHHTRKIHELISESEGSELEADQLREWFHRWKILLSGFWKVYYPFQSKSNRKFKRQTEPMVLASHDLLEYELSAGEYLETIKGSLGQSNLYRMESPVNSERQTISFKEDIILKIQSLADNYYHALWSSCSKAEKYAMYDLAVDGLINTKNREAIYMLMNKGILVKRGTLKFMNESFRNFILTIVNPDDEFRMRMEINRVGTWSKFRTPILLIIVGAAFFIAFAQEAVFNKILAVLTSVLALVPLVMKLNTIFSKPSAKSDRLS